MKNLAIIPARSGSKGLKDKNIIEVNGMPLMGYTIKAALESNCFEEVMVSTDSDEYAKIAISLGAKVPFLRSNINSNDSANSWDAVREVLNNYKEKGKNFDVVVLLQPTSPLRDANDIRNAFSLLKEKKANNVVSVCEVNHPIQWCFPLDETLSLEKFANSPYNSMRRQELQKHYMENGAIYLTSANKILDEAYNLYKDNCIAYIMPKERSIDIDGEIDLEVFKTLVLK